MFAMHIITLFFPFFLKFPEAVRTKSVRGVDVDMEVDDVEVDEVDEKW